MESDKANQVSIKLYLPDGTVRRLTIEEGAPLKRLVKRVQNMHPEYDLDAEYNLRWKDEEGDMITLSSNDDLVEASRHLDNGLLRVFIMAKEDTRPPPSTPRQMSVDQGAPTTQQESAPKETPQESAEKPAEENEQEDADPELHRHVVCDGCNGEVRGLRFKCCVCPDFDLCETCEIADKHPEHPLIKITPQQGRDFRRRGGPHRGQFRFGPMHGRRMRCPGFAFGVPPPMGPDGQPMGPPPHRFWGCPPPPEGRRRRFPRPEGCFGPGPHGPHGPAGPKCGRGGWQMPPGFDPAAWGNWFQQFSEQVRTNLPTGPPPSTTDASAWNQWLRDLIEGFKNMSTNSAAAGSSAQGEPGENSADNRTEDEKKAEQAAYLYQIGDQIAHFLGQMGIDVDVDVEEWFNQGVNTDGKDKEKETPVKEQPKPDEGNTAASAPEESMEAEQNKDKSSTPVRETEFVFVHDDEKETGKTKDNTGGIYPNIPKDNQASTSNTDGRIEASLQHMLNMGFTNEGGWLKTLLISKNGDISSVLDVLQRAKPKA